jgi:hypothetical protein
VPLSIRIRGGSPRSMRSRSSTRTTFSVPTICSSLYRLFHIQVLPRQAANDLLYRRTLASHALNGKKQLTSCFCWGLFLGGEAKVEEIGEHQLLLTARSMTPRNLRAQARLALPSSLRRWMRYRGSRTDWP